MGLGGLLRGFVVVGRLFGQFFFFWWGGGSYILKEGVVVQQWCMMLNGKIVVFPSCFLLDSGDIHAHTGGFIPGCNAKALRV